MNEPFLILLLLTQERTLHHVIGVFISKLEPFAYFFASVIMIIKRNEIHL